MRDAPWPAARQPILRPLLLGGLLLIAIVVALVVAELVVGASRSDVEHLGPFLLGSATASLVLGVAAMRWASHRAGGLRLRVVLAFAIGLAIALVNVVTTSA